MRTRSYGSRRKPRAAWAALATGVVVSFLIVVGVLLPVLGLIGAADATTAGVLDVPVGAIILSIVISYLIALAFLALAFVSRNAALAWVAAVAAVIATLVGSVWPLLATAFASVDQAGDVIPFIQDLIARVTG
ncbi:hypothetical protein EDF35_1107 [Rathayibacter sp. PhB151]|uniref:hypothetical protein n=1 Tax=Rathayibacter sp. PhB151 TaxID=2485189 RepID=UPI0010637416|nr:hypothetical protein [Rathayibacter sp. PhB151]TDX81440.1 hypothetical protein EDF35_1107 [Rathayibacter sp. PhB151]